MPNNSGKVYGLTILSPILNDDEASPSHDLQIRSYLAGLSTGRESPFAQAPGTHLARLVVMDDVIFVGAPAVEEHLNSKYLIFESNCDPGPDGTIDSYLQGLAEYAGAHLDAIWSHCVGYPGASDRAAFVRYMKACQLVTTFFFAAVNDKSVPETLRALQTQKAVADFVETHQGMQPGQLRAEFLQLVATLDAAPMPAVASATVSREMKIGGRNE